MAQRRTSVNPQIRGWQSSEEEVSRELPVGAGADETAHANPDSLDTPTIPQFDERSQLPM